MAPTNRVSIAVARFIPVFLVLVVAYATYVVIGPLTIDYLLNPSQTSGRPRRSTAGIVIPTIYGVLLIPVAGAWLRLLMTVLLEPGYIPFGSDNLQRPTLTEPQDGLEAFWLRDVFVCDPNGLPIWCDRCHNWKPDRTHHNQDVGRCTRKMDHFCPWVGGVVGERSFKFFIQFLFYSMVFTAYLTGVFGYYVAESRHNVHWFVCLGLAAFFLLFTTGMVMNSLNMVFKNITTIEQVRGKMWMAVILPPEMQVDPLAPPPPAAVANESLDGGSDVDSDRPLTSDLDDPAHHNYFKRQPRPTKRQTQSHSPPPSKLFKGTITYPLQLPTDRPPIPAPEPRIFAILELPRGLNPWNLGSAFTNFKAVFGETPLDWILPLKHSPCCDHTSQISEYALGPEFEVLLVDAGLIQPDSRPSSKHRGDRRPSTSMTHSSSQIRRKRRRLDSGWQNGERPDGWVSEKEARRIRNEWRRRIKQQELMGIGEDHDPEAKPERPIWWQGHKERGQG